MTAGDVRIAGRTVFISIGDVKMRVECSSSLIPTVEEMSIEDETLKANWGDSIRRINFVSAPDAPLKGHYRISVTEI